MTRDGEGDSGGGAMGVGWVLASWILVDKKGLFSGRDHSGSIWALQYDT
jgi:hypothetical protein